MATPMGENERYDMAGRLCRVINKLVEQGGPYREVLSAIQSHEDFDEGNMEEFTAWWDGDDEPSDDKAGD
jgi:hypothetical protein